MLIAQITDLHLTPGDDFAALANAERLDKVITSIQQLDVTPDMVIATGDLVDDGAISSYHLLREKLSQLPCPVKLCLGNHDERASFQEVFGEGDFEAGHLQYVVEGPDLRILVLDTLQHGKHGGGFSERRAAWLSQALAASDQPTLIAMHHPPIPTGIPWMTPYEDEPWIALLEQCVRDQRHIVGVICGHIHRPIHRQWAGTNVMVCAATAGQVVLNMTPIDPDKADGRALINDEPPGYALHHWDGTALTTHRMIAGSYNTLASYGPTMESAMQSVFNVRKD